VFVLLGTDVIVAKAYRVYHNRWGCPKHLDEGAQRLPNCWFIYTHTCGLVRYASP